MQTTGENSIQTYTGEALEVVHFTEKMVLEWVMGHHVDTISDKRTVYTPKQLDHLLLDTYLDRYKEVSGFVIRAANE